MGALLYGLIRSKPEDRDQAAIEAARRKALVAWTIVEDALEGRSFLAGSELSLAEIVMGTLVYRWHAFPLERPAVEKPQIMVRAHARAARLQDPHRNSDHMIVRALSCCCVAAQST